MPAQFHIHAPSEHTFDGVSRDLELHFVHLYAGGGLGAVIGVTFDRVAGGNKDNYFLDQIIPVYNTSASVTELKAQFPISRLSLKALILHSSGVTQVHLRLLLALKALNGVY